MKTSFLIDPYMVWRLFTDLLSRLNYLLYLLFQPLFCLPSEFTFSSLHCSLIMWPELDLTGSWVRPMRGKMGFRDFLPHPFAFQYCAYLKTAKNKTKTVSLCYCLNIYHHLTQPFSSFVCLVCEKPRTYTLLKSNPICFWNGIMLLRCFLCMLHGSSFSWWCLFLPRSFWVVVISSLLRLEKSSRV